MLDSRANWTHDRGSLYIGQRSCVISFSAHENYQLHKNPWLYAVTNNYIHNFVEGGEF
jgi:hypothetical protein